MRLLEQNCSISVPDPLHQTKILKVLKGRTRSAVRLRPPIGLYLVFFYDKVIHTKDYKGDTDWESPPASTL